MVNWYNENDPFAAQWLRNLIVAGLIPPGVVDERSVEEVRADDLAGYTQCHFFAGLGGWSEALELAGWPADRPVWTGSCPCQPFSQAGGRKGFDDPRHLWPVWRGLIAERRPAVVFGEQVARASDWLKLVRGDLEALGYAVGCMPIEAASVGANHRRDRFWFVADSNWILADPGRLDDQRGSGECRGSEETGACDRAARSGEYSVNVADATGNRREPWGAEPVEPWKTRWPAGAYWWQSEPDVGRVAHGVSGRVGQLRALGNAIVPQVGAAFIKAYMMCAPARGR